MAQPALQPLRKGDKRERTRLALLDAAVALIKERGFENTTLDAVATRAGMTRGAIYGNFKNRDDLFLALAAMRWEPVIPRFRLGSTFREQMHALAEAVIAAAPERRKSAIGTASFQSYALTNEAMRQELVALNADLYRQTVRAMLKLNRESELPMPVETLVRVLHVLIEGILMQRSLSPEMITDDVIFAAFEALA
jgi:AcrR family transcriptional regulator